MIAGKVRAAPGTQAWYEHLLVSIRGSGTFDLPLVHSVTSLTTGFSASRHPSNRPKPTVD